MSDAVKYFKKHGYRHCKSACMQNGWLNTGFWVRLKRIVESHELVESFGGLDLARKGAHKNRFEFNAPLLKSIADVESCQ